MKKTLFSILTAFSFLFVLFFPQPSFQAAKSGLLLWYETLVPTLFPVMILSNLLLASNLAYVLTNAISRPFQRLLGIGPYGVYALLTGFLCGCPMGAKILSDLHKSNRITQNEAAYLAGFANNISPAFLTNFLVLGHLKEPKLLAPTLVILFGAPLLYGLFSNHRFRMLQAPLPGESGQTLKKNKTSATAINFAMVDACITDSIMNITKLGGYVILFSVLIATIDILPFKMPLVKAMLAGITEISGGIHAIAALSLPFCPKYLLLIAVSAFGGLCCTAQSAQMLDNIGISARSYLASKLMTLAIAVIMAVCYVY